MSSLRESTTIDMSSTPPVRITKLVKVELRKALDTRTGFWFSLAIVGLCLAAVMVYAFSAPDDQLNFGNFLEVGGGVLGYFLPILIIMLVTCESAQRTGLTTFSLEPRRSRVIQAKFGAGLVLTALALVTAAVVSALGTLVGSWTAAGGSPGWALDTDQVLGAFVLGNVLFVLVGFALAMLLMNTTAAIVAYFAYSMMLPVVMQILGALSETAQRVAPWVEFNTAQTPLFSAPFSPTGQEWTQIVTSGAIWLVVPLAVGVVRLLRIEFK